GGAAGPGGRHQPRHVRVISSSAKDLEAMMRDGAFRPDLYFRLAGYTVTIPPLRNREDELLALAREFGRGAAAARGVVAPSFAAEAVALLQRHRWPGNLHELRYAVECAVLLASDGVIRPEHLPPGLRPPDDARARDDARACDFAWAPTLAEPTVAPRSKLRRDLSAIERRRILEALEHCAGNQTRAAELLGIGRRTLLNRLDEYQIKRPRRPR
ncbi:MAG: sigma-54-dependent Fis family transcriptional regulator, partial [Deltaproteobacteria bacterium]|nr:sigma-54-dependent Fis family transcriptional regulator [Deltaproteobacteria bacterium]